MIALKKMQLLAESMLYVYELNRALNRKHLSRTSKCEAVVAM